MKHSKKRGIVVGLIFLSVIVGLVVHTGTGTESAFGWRDIAVICPVGSLEVLAGSRGLGLHTAILLVVVLVISMLLGKSFCSWACPTVYVRSLFGANHKSKKHAEKMTESDHASDQDDNESVLSDGVMQASSPDESMSQESGEEGEQNDEGTPLPPVGGERDGLRIDSRHAVLIGAIASSFVFGFPVFCLICPVGITFGIVIGLFNLIRFADATWSLLVFPAVLVLELVVFRKWCTHLCPISALLSLVSQSGRVVRPKVKTTVCLRSHGTDCHTCVETCPEQVDPHSKSIPECSNCGLCVDACPAKAIAMKLGAYTETPVEK